MLTAVVPPDLNGVAVGQATVQAMRAIEFSHDGRWLLVRTTFVDDVAPSVLRDVVSLYDVQQHAHVRIYNGLLGAGSTVNIQHAALAWVGQQAVVLVAYAVQGYDGGMPTRVAWFVDGVIQSADVVEAISREHANAAIEGLALSQDGRYLAIESAANNLVPELDTNDVSDVYLFDLQTRTVLRVSVLADGVTESPLPVTLRDVSVLSDGVKTVSFSTAGATLAAQDNNNTTDVFVWRMTPGISSASVTLVSRNPQGKAGAGDSTSAVLSDAGVFFSSTASDLVTGDGNGQEDVFLRGWSTTTIARASMAEGLSGAELDGKSSLSSVSADGRYLVWTSDAPAIGAEPGVDQVLIRDRATGSVKVVSKTETGTLGNDLSFDALISGNGQRVALTTLATNLAPQVETGGALLLVGDNPQAASLQGSVYHWKSHVLMSGVNLGTTSVTAVQSTVSDLFDLRSAKFNATTGVLTVEVWVNPTAGFGSFDFRAATVGATAASFIHVLPTDWTVTANVADPQSVRVSGLSLTNLTGATRLGTLQLTLPAGSTNAQVDFSSIAVGSANGAAQTLSMQGNTTVADGAYSFSAIPTDAALTASRAATDSASAITSADALAALRIAVGLNPNPDPDGASGPKTAPAISPYQIMAADVNNSGTVTSADALAILRMAVKLSTALPQEWLFVEERRDFWDEANQKFTLSRTGATWDRTIKVDPAATTVNLVAVLKGDVNGNWLAPLGSQDLDVLDPTYFQNLAQLIGVPNQDQWGGGP